MPTIGSRAGAGGWERGGEELQDKREDTHEVYMQNVIQRMHAYHWQQSWCGGLGLGGGEAARQ